MKHFFLLIFIVQVFSCTEQQERILPKKTKLTESVYSSVIVQPDSLYQAYAAVAGILDQNLVEEGDVVSKGDPLLQIINNTPRLSAENARLSLQLSRDNYEGSAAVLKGIEDEIAAAELSLKNDSVNFERQKKLWDQKIGAKVEFDSRKLAYQLSQNKLTLLKSRYARTKNELGTQLQQAENNYRTSQIANKDFTITSKINGKVYALNKNPGEIVTTMEPLAAVGSSSIFVIEMLVDEEDIVKLVIGQRALITLDAYKSEVFLASVSKIYPRKDERSQTFKVEAIFEDPPEILYPGLSGEGNIIIAEKENALTIPRDFLIGDRKVLTDNGVVEVSTGLQNLEQVEILDGINENTYLLKPEE